MRGRRDKGEVREGGSRARAARGVGEAAAREAGEPAGRARRGGVGEAATREDGEPPRGAASPRGARGEGGGEAAAREDGEAAARAGGEVRAREAAVGWTGRPWRRGEVRCSCGGGRGGRAALWGRSRRAEEAAAAVSVCGTHTETFG